MKFIGITFLLLSTFCFSQKIDCPVENGVTYYNESYDYKNKYIKPEINLCCETKIYSEKPISVISVSEGKVSGLILTGNLLSILVRKGDEFYVYGYLSSINVKKGDEVKIGDKIGKINKKSEFSDSGEYILNFSYWQGNQDVDIFDRLKCIKK
ncbi:hypothetical protein MASR1M29_10790 [Cloacibacterium normanense]